MKALKKLVAAVCSLAVIATMATTFVAHATIEYPTAPIVSSNLVDNGNGTYNVNLDVDVSNCASTGIGSITLKVDLSQFTDESLADLLVFDDTEEIYPHVDYLWYEFKSGKKTVTVDFTPAQPNVTEDGTYVYFLNWLTSTWYSRVHENIDPADTPLIVLKDLVLKEGVAKEDVALEFTTADVTIGDDTASGVADQKYYTTASKPLNVEEYGVGGGDEPVVPETVAATPVGDGVFEGFNGVDTDRSVAAMVDTTITKATNKVTWKINVTPQTGKTYTGPTTKEVTFGNIEAGSPMKVGLVVSYADADIAEVQITGIEY